MSFAHLETKFSPATAADTVDPFFFFLMEEKDYLKKIIDFITKVYRNPKGQAGVEQTPWFPSGALELLSQTPAGDRWRPLKATGSSAASQPHMLL